MRLGRNGEIIAETGFDGGSYTPRYESRTSVYLGDMTAEDIRIKKQVDARNKAVAAQNVSARAHKRFIERQRYALQDQIKQQIAKREAAADHKNEVLKAKGFERARAFGFAEDINPWVGSAFAGFGATGEQRINPDSAVDIDIVDANIASVKEYGINNWMEDPAALTERLSDADASYTKGKIWLQTLVDYAKTANRSVVGLPIASQVSQELSQVESAAQSAAKDLVTKIQITNAPAQPAQNDNQRNYVKYGLMALGAYLFLRK